MKRGMQGKLRGVNAVLTALIILGVAAGLWGAALRYRVEMRNRRVEIGVEWPEVALLAQMSQKPISGVLRQFQAQNVSTLIIPEDTLNTLEQAGAARAVRVTAPDGHFGTRVTVDSDITFRRIHAALISHGIAVQSASEAEPFPRQGATLFLLPANPATGKPAAQEYAAVGYTYLRSIGIGLPLDAIAAARESQLRIAGRISNFPGVRETSAEAVLRDLRKQGAETVIFSGDDVLGYRGQEKAVAEMLRDPQNAPDPAKATGLIFGEVEFGKQKGDEKIAAALHGDYIRVHSIQGAEMGLMEEDDAIERYVRAAKERNIRFCYVRLWTQAGGDPVGENVEFLKKISRDMEKGYRWTGGGMEFGAAQQFGETGVPRLLFGLIALGVAAGIVWLARLLAPLSDRVSLFLLAALGVVCVGLSLGAGEMGRKFVALFAGIAFPTIACLLTFPRSAQDAGKEKATGESEDADALHPAPYTLYPISCLRRAVGSLLYASGVTSLGIVMVIGLLATRPFILRANQFLGIKAQHTIPLIIVALVALLGNAASGETWERFVSRIATRTRLLLQEPARFGLLIAAGVALFGLLVIVERTGNDSSVGTSGGEMKFRAILDTILVVRPRTKEFLVGHPAFVLAVAWWWRGRRKIALPAFVVGSIGQVSLLNTFCHIHTPLIISLWRDGLGLLLGTLLGSSLFLVLEFVLPKPALSASVTAEQVLGSEKITVRQAE